MTLALYHIPAAPCAVRLLREQREARAREICYNTSPMTAGEISPLSQTNFRELRHSEGANKGLLGATNLDAPFRVFVGGCRRPSEDTRTGASFMTAKDAPSRLRQKDER